MLEIDWGAIFQPETPLLEIFVRGTAVYLGIFFLLRVMLKRQSGVVSIADLLVVVLIADAAQNGMAREYRSVTDGLLLVLTIVFWSYALDWLGYRFRWLAPLIQPPPLPLVRHGRLLRQNLERELITEDELSTQLRKQGLHDLREVEAAYMEGDGHISVIPRQKPSGSSRQS